ncbi:MAG: sulfotransferase domain-containing protein [Lentilitoribacter sp.]
MRTDEDSRPRQKSGVRQRIMEEKRNFILGLGHQKCGTSWLYKYLCRSDLFAEGYAKEFHVWDRLDIPIFENRRSKLKLKHIFNKTKVRDYRMENSLGYYFDYFEKLMRDGKFVTADITPSYSALRAKRLIKIRQEFQERNIGVKVVILVRDPLSRIKSAVRFNLDRGIYSEGISKWEKNFESALEEYYKNEHCLVRTTYQNIILEASKVFDEKDIFIGFYENMFEDDEIRRISKFLGIDAEIEFSGVYVNKTTSSVFETKLDSEIKNFYDDTYRFFYENYPISKRLWL